MYWRGVDVGARFEDFGSEGFKTLMARGADWLQAMAQIELRLSAHHGIGVGNIGAKCRIEDETGMLVMQC